LTTGRRGANGTARGLRASSWTFRQHRRRWLTLAERSTRSCIAGEQLEREIVAPLPGSPWALQVGWLRCLRGIDTLTAAGLCAEIDDFERSQTPGRS